MDARGVDRATALVCAPPTALTTQLALALADGGYDVHLPGPSLPADSTPWWARARLHTAQAGSHGDADEQALVGAVAGRARPLAVAVVDLTDGAARTETLEAVVAVMNGGPDARLVLLVDDVQAGRARTRAARRPQVGCEPHVGVLALVRHQLRPADRDHDLARRLARQAVETARTGRTRAVREPGRAGRVAALAHPVALRSVVARWSW